jgi:hypothetical protein
VIRIAVAYIRGQQLAKAHDAAVLGYQLVEDQSAAVGQMLADWLRPDLRGRSNAKNRTSMFQVRGL